MPFADAWPATGRLANACWTAMLGSSAARQPAIRGHPHAPGPAVGPAPPPGRRPRRRPGPGTMLLWCVSHTLIVSVNAGMGPTGIWRHAMAHAAGTFTVGSWDESTYQELDGDAKLTRATITFGMAGDITGEARWDAVMCYRPDGTAVYTGFQRVQGQVAGVDGSFVLRADGDFIDGEARSRWEVIEGSGTGGLSGLTGTGEAVATATPPG